MKFKKGDIVEVINKERYNGIDYPVGTQLRVRQDQKDHSTLVFIYDSLQKPIPNALLFDCNLKLVKREGENEMKLKLGETYICTKSNLSWFTEGKEYPVIVTDFGDLAIRDDSGAPWFDYELVGMTTRFKLIFKHKEENDMKFKIGDKVYGRDRNSEEWIRGEIVIADKQWGYRIKVVNADVTYAWLDTDTVKLLEETLEEPTLEEPTAYTQDEVNLVISKAYQKFDNDSQRLAYLQGYFAK